MTERVSAQTPKPERRAVLLRLDPAVYEALTRWARDDLRSVNAQVEVLLRKALTEAGRAPTAAAPIPRRGRPRSNGGPAEPDSAGSEQRNRAGSVSDSDIPAEPP